VTPFQSPHAGLARLGRCGGAALAVALVSEEARLGREALVIAVGDAVRDGLPTAARATVAGRGALTGLYSEGQVGSDLARRLSGVADALVLTSSEPRAARGDVLVVGESGLELRRLPRLVGLAPDAAHRELERELGPSAALLVGPAGERGLALASLAACSSGTLSSGGGPPHFVGRGGLGALLGRLGLKAVAVTAREPGSSARSGELVAALLASPRLLARAEGGTLELFAVHAARADLPGRDGRPFGGDAAAAYSAGIEATRAGRHGCAGCPTPCGWTFARPGLAGGPPGDSGGAGGSGGSGGGKQAARFAAVQGLGVALGLEDFGDALRVLERCDAAGLDAKELGAALAVFLAGRSVPPPAVICAWIDALASGTPEGMAAAVAPLALGAERLARSLDRPNLARCAKGSAIRADASRASLLGQCVSARGSDPLRTFPFLATGGGDAARLTRLSGLELPPFATDPARPEGKGRVVAWHEDLACALDASGFCAFSAGALLADGIVDLDQLARWIAPAALRAEPDFDAAPGRSLLALGQAMVLAQRDLQERWAPDERDLDRPAWARPELDRPGMVPEYRAVRGLDRHGRLLPATRSRFERGAPLCCPTLPATGTAEPAAPEPRPQAPGRVCLRSIGRPGASDETLELLLPAPLSAVLHASRSARLAPAVYRGGQGLAPTDLVHSGDELELVLVVPGG
jgi:aldehyde:ferredoxin oxidoreductase